MMEKAISQAVKIEIERAVKTATENAKAELDRRVPEIVAGLAIKIMEHVSMERLQNELLIHVRMDSANAPADLPAVAGKVRRDVGPSESRNK